MTRQHKVPLPGQQNIGSYGEELFRRYLDCHGIAYEREPKLSETKKVLDFKIKANEEMSVLVEVKTIYNPPPQHSGVFYNDPYPPIRQHLEEAFRQFTDLPNTLNVIALAAFPGSFVDLTSPHVMMGAMYGDTAFQFPFDIATGKGDADKGTNIFVAGNGPMIRRSHIPRNTRIAAVLSLQNPDICMPVFPERGTLTLTDAANQFVARLRSPSTDAPAPHVICWDNAAAKAILPTVMFDGPMDQRWRVEDGYQFRAFVGSARRKREEEQDVSSDSH